MSRFTSTVFRTVSAINRQLASEHPGPHGPRYWLLEEDGRIAVRGWCLGFGGNPMGCYLMDCSSIEEALAWIGKQEAIL